jgi:hypothetical protein
MFPPKRTALYLAVSALALAAGEASAGCKYIPNPPGSLVCASWITGSDVCEIASTGQTSGSKVISATCSITGATFQDGYQGGDDAPGAYCSSGQYPPGVCTGGKPAPITTTLSTRVTQAQAPTSAHPPQPCLPGQATPTSAGPLNQCPGLIVPGGDGFLTEDTSTPSCGADETDTSKTDCMASAEILPPDGSTCPNGRPAIDFTATAMLAIAQVDVQCVGSGCIDTTIYTDTIYEYCTVDSKAPPGTQYSCVDISDQGTRCDNPSGNPLTFAPDDPMCGQPRTCD